LPASQVRTQIVFVDQAAAQGLQCNGQTFSGPVTRVTVDDIISRFGPRRPAAGSAPTQFRVATILVTRDDLATPEEMWLYSYFAARGELRERVPTHSGFLKELGQPFYLATGGRATLDMSIKLSGPDFSLVPTPSSRTVAAGSPATFSISAMPQGGSFDDTVRFTCGALPANASCSFSPTDVVPGTTGRDVVFTIATRSGTAEATGAVGGLAVSAGLVVAAAMTRPRGPRRRRAPAHWLEPFSLSCSEQSCGINPERSRSRAVSCYEEVRTALVVAALLLLPSCGKGGTGAPPPANPPPQTTPAGTYQITVTGTSGNLLRSTTVTLVVQ